LGDAVTTKEKGKLVKWVVALLI